MSSSTILPAPTTTAASDSNPMGQRGANYFFGFLITFVVLFLVFVGCGIGSRRRLLAERREASLMGDAWAMSRSDAEQKRPAFYEYALGVPVQVDQWEYITVSTRPCLKHLNLSSTASSFPSFGLVSCDLATYSLFPLQPLSAALGRPPKEPPDAESGDDPGTYSPPHTDLEAARSEPTRPYSIFSGFALPHWGPTRSNDKAPPEPDEEVNEKPEELSVAVMIAMPCSVTDRRATFDSTDFSRLRECQIGTTIVPWHSEVPTPLPSKTTTAPQPNS